jgi:hypothetical protein
LLYHKCESLYIPNYEHLNKPTNEISIKYLFKHKANKSKHQLDHCFSSIEYINENTLVLGTYFSFKIFLYKFKENILEQIIGNEESEIPMTDNDPDDDENSEDNDYFIYTDNKYKLKSLRVKERNGSVDKITIIDDCFLSAVDQFKYRYYICDYINKTIIQIISMSFHVVKNLDAYYTEGQIFHFNENVGLTVRPEGDEKLNGFDIYSFGEFLAFKNKKRIYVYQLDKAENHNKYKKIHKYDETNGISTDLVVYKDNTYLFGNSKGELKQLSFTDKFFKIKIKLQEGRMNILYRYNNKVIISTNDYGVIKFSDYQTLYTNASINTYHPVSKILCLPNNKLLILSTEKGNIQKNENNYCCKDCDSNSSLATHTEYYDTSFLFTWDLREKDSFSTGFKHNQNIQAFIELSKDNSVSISDYNINLWRRKKLIKTLRFGASGSYYLKRLNEITYLAFGNYRILIYKWDTLLRNIACYYDHKEPVKILDEYSFIYGDSNSLYYLNINSIEYFTYIDKFIRFSDMVYEQGKLIYLKEKTLFCFNTQTLRSNKLKKGGAILEFRKKDSNTICFNTKDFVYELDIGTMQITQI